MWDQPLLSSHSAHQSSFTTSSTKELQELNNSIFPSHPTFKNANSVASRGRSVRTERYFEIIETQNKSLLILAISIHFYILPMYPFLSFSSGWLAGWLARSLTLLLTASLS